MKHLLASTAPPAVLFAKNLAVKNSHSPPSAIGDEVYSETGLSAIGLTKNNASAAKKAV